VGLIIPALVPVMPFTEQFARETTPQAYWASPTFKRINLTGQDGLQQVQGVAAPRTSLGCHGLDQPYRSVQVHALGVGVGG
jgi:hypothetical protein